jgi:hypothetical protein
MDARPAQKEFDYELGQTVRIVKSLETDTYYIQDLLGKKEKSSIGMSQDCIKKINMTSNLITGELNLLIKNGQYCFCLMDSFIIDVSKK